MKAAHRPRNTYTYHKVALTKGKEGEAVYKYGQLIDLAVRTIEIGEHVHIHNLVMVELASALKNFHPCPKTEINYNLYTFQGYIRNEGSVGTRNYIGIFSTVNCSATVAKAAMDVLNQSGELSQVGFDGVVAITHGSGCAVNTVSEDFTCFKRIIAGDAQRPNFAFVLIIDLGCGTNPVKMLVKRKALEDASRLEYFNIQYAGATRSSIKTACDYISARPETAHICFPRAPDGCSAMRGLDGYSGITHNPPLGRATALTVQQERALSLLKRFSCPSSLLVGSDTRM